MSHHIRLLQPSDIPWILKIYAPFIEHTAITFETEVPDLSSFTTRILDISQHYPFLVYETDGCVAGYAYASKHRERWGYRFNVDVSIYISPAYQKKGIAYMLYEQLFLELQQKGYYNAYAICTADNIQSINFHKKFDFYEIGVFPHTGHKLGQWHDVMWLGKTLNDHNNLSLAHPLEPSSMH